MAAEINFRSHYYDKVGINESKSIEILLNEKPVDVHKLLNFCRKFCIPSAHRIIVWKILLGVLPTYEDAIKSIESDQMQQWKDLRHALEIMRIVNESTPVPDAVVIMYLLGEGHQNLDIEQQLQDEEVQHIRSIASAFAEICESEQDVYWMTRNFWLLVQKLSIDPAQMGKQMEDILEKEDHELCLHLAKAKAFPALPIGLWFRRCFADVLETDALVRIWDKIIGGTTKILPQVGATLLMTLRSNLIHLQSATEILKVLEKAPKDVSDAVVNKVLA